MRKQILLAFCLSLALQLFGQENAYEQYTFSPAYGTYTGCNDECITCTRIDYNTNTRITGGTEAYTSGILQSKVTWIGEDGSVIFTIRKCSGNFVQGNSGKIFVVDLHEGHVEYTGFYISDNSTNTLTVAYNAAWSGYSNKVFEIYYITSNQANKIFAGCHTVRRLHQYSVSTSTNPANVASTSGDGQYTENSTCTVRAYDNNYYSFNYWKKDGSIASYNSTYSFTVTGNHSLVAYYNLRSYNVTASATEGGSASGSGSYNAGGTATLTATPNCGYRFVRWTDSYGNEVSTNTNYSFTVAGDATYTAEFEAVERVKINGLWYTINCSAGTARVAYETSTFPYYITCPTGDIVVPSSISYGGNNYTVEGIDSYAFYRCTGITSVTIPSSVLVIGWSAFDGCTSLTSVHIPSSVSSIADYAFSNCTSLESITVESGNPMYDSRDNCNAIVQTSINQLIFGCKNSTIPNTIAKIRGYAFSNCPGLTTVTIPNSVTLIGGQAFERCTGLTTVTIGESVTRLGNSVFYGCSNLTSITSLAEVCPTTGTNVFDNVPTNIPVYVPCGSVSSYQSVDVWSDFTNIQEVAGCSHTVTAVANDDTYGIVTGGGSYSGGATATLTATANCGYRYVRWTAGGVEVSTDASYSFTVTSDTTVTAVFEAADKVQINGIWYTLDNSNNTATVVSENNTSPYYTTYPTDDVFIPSSVVCGGNSYAVTTLAANAFAYCPNITSVTIPNSVTSIGNHAFYGCTNLTSVTIPNSVTSIGQYSFGFCLGLTSVTIPNSVTDIGMGAFGSSRNLTSVTIGNSVTSIGIGAFSSCSSIASVNYTGTVAQWCNISFGNNYSNPIALTHSLSINGTSVTDLVIPDGVTQIKQYAFYNYSSLTSVTIPSSVTSIATTSFYGCSGLTEVTIPNSVTSIGNHAFYNCSGLMSVTIGNSVTGIGFQAFDNCSGITSIVCYATVPPALGNYTFRNVPTNVNVQVPCGSVSSYQSVDGWSDFTNIQETSGCTFTVTVVANNDAYGTVTGSGTYATGETVTITATPNCGYWFTHWQDSWGNTLGYSPTYTFTINSNVERTAMFEEYPLTSNIYDVCSTGQTLLYDIHCPEGTATLTGYTGTCTGDLVIPDHINVGGRNYTVDSIATGAFSSNWNPEATVTSVVIPNSVTYIGAAFFNMPLTSVHIGNGVTEIESGAFDFCEHITSIVIDPANTYYDSRNNCNAIIKTSTNEIIRGCNTTTFPSTVTSIGDNAFSNCSVNFSAIPESITLIRRGAFMNCVFPSSTLIVECGGDIMEEAFFYANGFSSVSIGAAVRGIDGSAFAGCDLATITVNSANTTYDSRNNCNAVIHTTSNVLIMGCKNTIIPEEVTEIGYSAFRQQHNLTSIVIPDNVTTIHAEAFYYDGRLQSITLGRGLSLIEGYSFINCDALRSITLLSETPPTLDGYVFHTGNPSEYDFRPNCTLFVPCGRVATYQASAGWSDFTSIQEVPGCSFTVTVSANDASYGTVTGSGSYAIGDTATLTATSNIGYAFVQWNDGNTDNPRQVVVTSDTMLVAMFEARTHYVQLIYSQGMTVRTIEGSTTVPHGGSVTLEAVTDDCHHFTRWDDNSTNPVRRIENVVSDTTVVAYGESYRYTVNATGSTGGTVTSDYDSQVNCGTTVTLTATADGGYTFVRWSDNNTDNPRQITVTDNITLTAIFAATRFNVTVTANNSSWGSVTGSGEYNDGATATLTATANNGYSFVRWDDGNTDNPRSIVVVSDTVLTALFTHPGTTYNIRTCNGQTLLFAVENINHTATVIGYVGLCAGNLIVPAWFSVDDERYTVTAIGPRAFENCTGLVSVTLPITITLVDEEAFKGCTGLIEVDMK